MERRRHYRTLVLSDIHLGTSHSKTEEVSHFLSHVDCDRLILNGDIIDGWHLRKFPGQSGSSHVRQPLHRERL
ncbi:conserved domain protein [Paraprevotella xylaniphila YIT 11841]|jgi:UDP-2,3-diacylglucosamine pyrophosphatase LpxH|uniref:Conserved domain protein n=1 Tax=Paraprevotella xylaniphila YIT 11841 TaxID=762982 RepID=F3QRV0_9BACT|nr:conserved domain protein [Paraprevotella xylaniphila YIT 11841]